MGNRGMGSADVGLSHGAFEIWTWHLGGGHGWASANGEHEEEC